MISGTRLRGSGGKGLDKGHIRSEGQQAVHGVGTLACLLRILYEGRETRQCRQGRRGGIRDGPRAGCQHGSRSVLTYEVKLEGNDRRHLGEVFIWPRVGL